MRPRTFLLNTVSVAFLGVFIWGAIKTTGPAGADDVAPVNNLSLTFKMPDAGDGVLRVALFNTPETYNSSSPMVYKTVPVEARETVKVTFADLTPGDYAVKVFQDKDRDANLDTNGFGIPDEAYGFSTNARALFGPPKWGDAKFALKDGANLQPIMLQ